MVKLEASLTALSQGRVNEAEEKGEMVVTAVNGHQVLGSMDRDHWTLPHCRVCRDDAAQAVDQSRLCLQFPTFRSL